jgi:hypothetical protein
VTLSEPVQSSNTSYNVREAGNAIDGDETSIMHTDNERPGWWSAKFQEGTYKVNQVKFLNRPDGWGHRLGDSIVEIDGKVCGTVQSETVQNVWYDVYCETPILGRSVKVISKEGTPLHFAEIRVFGEKNQQCMQETCTDSQFLLKSGRCQDCPTGWIQDPNDNTNCIYGGMIRQIACKRGHRVDQLKITNYVNAENMSHNGFAGGSWKENDQLLTLAPDEYVKRVDGFHITSGNKRDELSKVTYTTNMDRMVTCHNKDVKYNTEKKSFVAEEGKFISHIGQYEDARKCCGRIVEIGQEDLPGKLEKAIDEEFFNANCSATQYLTNVDQVRTCNNCETDYITHPDSIYKCKISCGDYTYEDSTAVPPACMVDTCNKYEFL